MKNRVLFNAKQIEGSYMFSFTNRFTLLLGLLLLSACGGGGSSSGGGGTDPFRGFDRQVFQGTYQSDSPRFRYSGTVTIDVVAGSITITGHPCFTSATGLRVTRRSPTSGQISGVPASLPEGFLAFDWVVGGEADYALDVGTSTSQCASTVGITRF